MVSKRERGRGRRLSLACMLLVAGSCSRSADIEQSPDRGVGSEDQVPLPEGGVPLVEGADLGDASADACQARAGQPSCAGANDFGCNFGRWLPELVEACQQQTDCHTDGWVQVQLGSNGCATELRMEDPDVPFVQCMTERLRAHHCPCKEVAASVYLGLGHDGCVACGTGELRCPPGSTCQDGQCVEDETEAGGAGP